MSPTSASYASFQLSRDGHLVIAEDHDRHASIWRLPIPSQRTQPLTLPAANLDGEYGRWSFGDPSSLVLGTSSGTFIWDLDAKKPDQVSALSGGGHHVLQNGFIDPSGHWIATIRADLVELWDAARLTAIGQALIENDVFAFDGHPDAMFSDDGHALLVSGGRTWLFEPTRHGLKLRYDDIFEQSRNVEVAPDGNELVVYYGFRTTIVRYTDQGSSYRIFDPSFKVVFGPHRDRFLLGRDASRLLMISDIEREATPLFGHDEGITAAAFSPDGSLLVTGDTAGMVRVWTSRDLGSGDFPGGLGILAWQDIERRVGRNLTCDEWKQIFPSAPYHRTFDDLPTGCDAPLGSVAAQ